MTIQEIIKKAKPWLHEPFDKATQQKVQQLIDLKSNDLVDSFYQNMVFGTGGMRGIMGVGTNRINKYTLGRATQGLANYLHKVHGDKKLKVAIAFDCRHNSKTFGKLVADVLTANNIKVFLFEDLRPTPELSFTVRYLNCDAGIVLTASHNPPEYNGYKVYWDDGAQIVPPQDAEIITEVNAVEFAAIKFSPNADLLTIVGTDIDDPFIKACISHGTFNTQNRNKLKIVYTSLHGSSIMSIPKALKGAGFTDVNIVEEQRIPNGDFPTVQSPNPEEPAALKMATELANKINAEIVIGTDPDSDRIGIAVRDMDGNLKLLNGNQVMSVMTAYLIKQWHQSGKLDGTQFVASTIVSTHLVNDIAESNNVEIKVGLTGFKWIAKMIRDAEGKQEFIGGGEESFGYMVGDFIRDKDAVTATLLACEIAIDAKNNNSSFYEELLKLYCKYGYYKEQLISIVKKGIDGSQQIEQMMIDLRNSPVKTIDGSPVEFIYDYQSSICKNLLTGEHSAIEVPRSNVLIYHTVDGTKIAARPSGTEPKIKFYFSVKHTLHSIDDAPKIDNILSLKIQKIIKEMQLS
jgi:phosphoglucomutase